VRKSHWIPHTLGLLSAFLACAGSPGLEPAEADPEATWKRASAQATRGQRSNRKGDLIVAESNLQKALAAARNFPEGDPRLLETRYALARLHHKQGRYRLAIRELEALVPELERLQGAASPLTTATLLTLCSAEVDAGRFERAQGTCGGVLEIQLADPETTATARGATKLLLASAERGLRHFEASEAIYLELLAQMPRGRRSVADAAVEVKANDGLGVLYTEQRRLGEAEPRFLKALSILVRRQGRETPDYAIVLRNLGDLYLQMRRYDDASQRYDLALARFKEIFGQDHFQVRDTLLRIADLRARTGHPREADELRYQAEAIPDPRT
jgi:tetratricopeptide (TPR) repeat protein